MWGHLLGDGRPRCRVAGSAAVREGLWRERGDGRSDFDRVCLGPADFECASRVVPFRDATKILEADKPLIQALLPLRKRRSVRTGPDLLIMIEVSVHMMVEVRVDIFS